MIKNQRAWIVLTLFLVSLSPVSGVTAEQGLWNASGGQPQSIEQYAGKGKWLVVMIWVSDCHVCNQEVRSYLEFHKRHTRIDASVLGVSMDGKLKEKEALAFIQKHKLTFPNLIGEPETVAQKFTEISGAAWIGTPTFLIYAPDGELLAQQTGAAPVSLIEDFIRSNQEKYTAKSETS